MPPGVDHLLFVPGDRARARERLHLSGLRLALYVGRLQPHKGPDVAVRTLAEAVARDPEAAGDLVLAIVGGPSGPDKGAEVARLLELAAALGVSERVMLFPPQPQSKLVDFYTAADVVLVPSRSESFGLVALEAQACGTPVVAADVGGLPYVVEDGRSGFLVEGHDPGDHADRLLQILRRPSAPVVVRRRGGPSGAAVHMGRDDRPDGVGVRRGARAPPLTCAFIVRCDIRHPPFGFVTLLRTAHYQRIHALTCGNVELTMPRSRPYSSPRSKQSKHRREETGRGSGAAERRRRNRENRRRPQGQTRDSGEPTKAARPEAEPSGPGRRRKDEAGSGPRRHTLGWAAGEPRRRGSAARRAGGRQAIGAPSGEPNPPGTVGHRRDERGGCLEHLSPRG